MSWFKVDDKLHDHHKTRKAGKAAMGVWVLAGSWAMDNGTDGFVPSGVLSRWGNRRDAAQLCAANLWFVDKHCGETGWRFHDWEGFQPSAAVTAARRAAEAVAGVLGNHKRWHIGRGVNDPNCEYCYRVPDQVPDQVSVGYPESPPIPPVPVPHRRTPNGVLHVADAQNPPRPDVASICEHLANRIEANGSKRPTITKTWHDAARLMIDTDNRDPNEIHQAIDWCQTDDFWRANILSLPKLRTKYDQLRLSAQRTTRNRNDIDWDAAFARARAADAEDARKELR